MPLFRVYYVRSHLEAGLLAIDALPPVVEIRLLFYPILYVDPNKNRTDTWLTVNGLQLPLAVTKYGPIKSVTYPDGNVNRHSVQENEENAKTKKNEVVKSKHAFDGIANNSRSFNISLSQLLKNINPKDEKREDHPNKS